MDSKFYGDRDRNRTCVEQFCRLLPSLSVTLSLYLAGLEGVEPSPMVLETIIIAVRPYSYQANLVLVVSLAAY